jgi:hypothetical protein
MLQQMRKHLLRPFRSDTSTPSVVLFSCIKAFGFQTETHAELRTVLVPLPDQSCVKFTNTRSCRMAPSNHVQARSLTLITSCKIVPEMQPHIR